MMKNDEKSHVCKLCFLKLSREENMIRPKYYMFLDRILHVRASGNGFYAKKNFPKELALL